MDTQFADMLNDAFKLAAKIVSQPADAQDVIQDAAAIALSHDSAPSQTSLDFKPWFYRIVRNKAIDRVRADVRQDNRHGNHDSQQLIENVGTESGVNTSSTREPQAMLLASEVQAHIDTALMSVSVDNREIVLLKDYHGFSYEEIASILDVPKGSVMSKLHRARVALRTKLTALARGGI